MKLIDLISKIKNGSVHILLFSSVDGVIIAKTIWHNTIPHIYYGWEVDSIEIRDYEIRLGIHE